MLIHYLTGLKSEDVVFSKEDVIRLCKSAFMAGTKNSYNMGKGLPYIGAAEWVHSNVNHRTGTPIRTIYPEFYLSYDYVRKIRNKRNLKNPKEAWRINSKETNNKLVSMI